MKKILTSLSMLALVLVGLVVPLIAAPTSAHAADEWYSGFVKCDGVVKMEPRVIGKDDQGQAIVQMVQVNPQQVKCDFKALVDTVMSFITWFMGFSVALCVGLISYAGILYMTAEKAKIETAKSIFFNVTIGFVVILVSWTLIYSIVQWVVKPEFLGTVTSFLEK